ncbi:MAG: hypothetical protein AB7S26_41465 [Sandaracinaceae bacterium]
MPEDPYAEARAALSACPASVQARMDAIERELELTERQSVRRDGDWLIVTGEAYGYGLDGASTELNWLFHVPSCFETQITLAYENAAPFVAMARLGDSDVGPPIEWLLLAMGGDPFDAYDAERHSLTRLLLGHEHGAFLDCPTPPAQPVGDPLASPQPWFDGPPTAQRIVYDQASGHVFLNVGAPRSTRGFIVVPLRSAYAGVAIGVYDRRRDRHRWIVDSTLCVYGTPHWLGTVGEWMLAAMTAPRTEWPTTIVAISRERGIARPLRFRVLESDDGVPLAYGVCPRRRDSEAEEACLRARMSRGALEVSSCDPDGACRSERVSARSLLAALEAAPPVAQPADPSDDGRAREEGSSP